MKNTVTKKTNPVTGQVTEKTYSNKGRLMRTAVYDAVELGGYLVLEKNYAKNQVKRRTL